MLDETLCTNNEENQIHSNEAMATPEDGGDLVEAQKVIELLAAASDAEVDLDGIESIFYNWNGSAEMLRYRIREFITESIIYEHISFGADRLLDNMRF